jgi:uncharacterized damage-inducible protein DinB
MPQSPKQLFLDWYDREHERTMRALRAYPADKLDLKPHELSKTARELAWMFVLECGLATRIWRDELVRGGPASAPPAPPQEWNDLLAALEKASSDYRALVAATSDADLDGVVHFFVGPKQMGEYTRMDIAWFFLFDQIHHRGQFSIYLRMSGARVPSIYGPTADEPWR